MAVGKFCLNCGMLVYPGTTCCKNCSAPVNNAPHAHSGQTQVQSWKSLGIRVEEFKSKKDFNGWLEKMYARIKVLRVIPYTLPWLTECYTVTYELFISETPPLTLAPSLEIQTGS